MMAHSEKDDDVTLPETNPEDTQQPDRKRRKLDDIQITDQDINDVINLLGRDDLHKLFHALDLSSRDVDNAERKAGTLDVGLKAKRVFETWRQRNGQQATRGRVLCALEKCGNKNAKEQLEEKWKMKGGPCHQFDLTTCQEELITYYTQKMGTVQLLPWCDDTRAMEDIYVSLELEERRGRTTSQLKCNENLVTLNSNNRPATRVLVKGVAGSGKSTLLAKLAYNWAQQKHDSPLGNFDLVFILSLREVQRDYGLIDAIFQQILPKDTQVSEEQLLAFIKKHPSKVLILLDGFDEYVNYEAKTEKDNGIDDILHYEVLRDCCVIVSTRPHKDISKHQSCYVSVNLTGFSPENITLYMTKFFNGNTEMVEGLSNRLKESDILTSLSTIPVMLMLMCLLWEEEQKLPDTQSELYEQFALYLWKKYCTIKERQIKDDTLEVEFNKGISELGQAAFEGICPKGNIKEEKIVFSHDDFTPSHFALGCETGLLTSERLRSKLKIISSVTFLHKSFQEYCAAKYWANLFDTDPDKFHCILMQLDTWDAFLGKMGLLKFCCGLVDKAGRIDIIHHAIHLIKDSGIADTRIALVGNVLEHKDKELVPILNLLHESQITSDNDNSTNKLHTNQQYDQVCNKMLAHKDHQQYEHDEMLLSLDQAVKSLFSSGELQVNDHSRQTLPIFHNFVKSAYGLSSLTAIKSVRFENFLCASLDVIIDTLKCMPAVQKIRIELYTEDDEKAVQNDHHAYDMKLLGEKLSTLTRCTKISCHSYFLYYFIRINGIVHALSQSPYCPSYTHITFSHATFNTSDMVQLLSKTKLLKKLTLTGNKMTPSDVISVLDAIQSKIEHLSLSENDVGEAIGHIGHIMTPHLQTLQLENASLNDDHLTNLSKFFPKASNLERLGLAINDFRNTGIHAVFQHIHLLIQLKYFWIHATIDDQCSDLVKDCLSAIDETIPNKGSHRFEIVIHDHSKFQLLINVASKYDK